MCGNDINEVYCCEILLDTSTTAINFNSLLVLADFFHDGGHPVVSHCATFQGTHQLYERSYVYWRTETIITVCRQTFARTNSMFVRQ